MWKCNLPKEVDLIELTTDYRGSVSDLRFYIQGAAGGPTIDQNSGNNGKNNLLTPCLCCMISR